MNKILTVTCPTCKKTVQWLPENTFKPFCCERCKLIDLGAWASEDYRVPDKPVTDEDESL